ncbi:MAG: KEOPS complex subunit Pcc1 [Desulfurococcaceae archaeon]
MGELRLEIVIEGDPVVLQSMRKSLSPDNKEAPPGITILDELSGTSYVISIKGRFTSRSIRTVRQTTDEILSLITAIHKLRLVEQ